MQKPHSVARFECESVPPPPSAARSLAVRFTAPTHAPLRHDLTIYRVGTRQRKQKQQTGKPSGSKEWKAAQQVRVIIRRQNSHARKLHHAGQKNHASLHGPRAPGGRARHCGLFRDGCRAAAPWPLAAAVGRRLGRWLERIQRPVALVEQPQRVAVQPVDWRAPAHPAARSIRPSLVHKRRSLVERHEQRRPHQRQRHQHRLPPLSGTGKKLAEKTSQSKTVHCAPRDE